MKHFITTNLLAISLLTFGVEITAVFSGIHATTLTATNISWSVMTGLAVATVPACVGGALAMSVEQFCQAHGISKAFFYKLRAAGLGPVEMKLGARTLISIEAAAAWRRQRERDTLTPQPKPNEPRVKQQQL